MSRNKIRTNSSITLKLASNIRGIIDAHAYHSSRITWPLKLMYVQANGEIKSLKEIVKEKFPYCKQGMFTIEAGNHLVDANTKMYNSNKGAVGDLDENSVPSLIIATTMDMEFAHLDGYEGRTVPCDDTNAFEGWKKQIKDVEMTVFSNPLRLFPLFSYDPRRYRLPNENIPEDKECERWDKPFTHIVGCKDFVDGINKIWLGFCMNPTLGFRPFDEFCEHLPRFYRKCVDDNIPILARCIPGGITTHEAKRYKGFKVKERSEKNEERHKIILREGLSNSQNTSLGSDVYYGKERIIDEANLDHFYRNYGHPRNWIPVLKYFPDLRLCLAGFGGNNVWQYVSLPEWATDDEVPGREWIMCTIKITRYKNVYVDISGLNIYNEEIKGWLLDMLYLIQSDYDEFKHLKHKLIFGSGWYLTHLMDMDNNMDYSSYCSEFKKLFDEVDEFGKLWERVSLINPWNFYALSDDKINKIYDELAKNTDGNVNGEMLKKMKAVFDDSEENEEGLVNYIFRHNEEEPPVETQEPDEEDEDLIAIWELPAECRISDSSGHRGIDVLHPCTRRKVQRLLTKCAEEGLNVLILDTLRTLDEQRELYRQATGITNTEGVYSLHTWGVAFDFCRNTSGKEYDNSDSFFNRVGELGKQVGLFWGGDFSKEKNKWHFEDREAMRTDRVVDLISIFSVPEKFFATW